MTPHLPLLAAAAAMLLTVCSTPTGPCGDQIIDPGEACDAPGDGCDAACHLTGATAWTLVLDDTNTAVELFAVAVDPSGQIIVPCASSSSPTGVWLRALDSDGSEQWQTELPPETISPYGTHMVIDDAGFIYIQGGGLQRYTPNGAPSWQVAPEPRAFVALTVDDNVYAAGFEVLSDGADGPERYALAVQCRDAATGASVWERTFDDDAAADDVPVGVAVLGDTVHVAGWRNPSLASSFRPVHVMLDAATGASGPLIVDDVEEMWQGFAAGREGDLVIVGGSPAGSFVRRVAPDGTVREAQSLDLGDAVITDLVLGDDDSIVVAGHYDAAPEAFIRGLTRAGKPAWNVEQAPADGGNVLLTGAAFGPGFLIAVGTDEPETGRRTGWIRKIGPGPDTRSSQ